MTTSLPSLWLRLALTFLIAGGGIVFSTEADARGLGKRAGWVKRSSVKSQAAATNQKAKAPRKGLFTRVAEKRAERVRLAVAAQPKPGTNRSVAISIPSSNPRSAAPQRRTVPTTPKPVKKPTAKRTGLLARLFAIEDLPPTPAARPKPAAPKKPQLAPGQPNANQSAPKINHGLIANSSKSQSSVTINIARQRAYVYIKGQVAIDTPVSTARTGKYTPRGTFSVGERVHSGKISTIYDVEMPRWMRLGGSAYGMHAGYLPGYPASAGCIRMPFSAADAVYKATGHGTRVKIISG